MLLWQLLAPLALAGEFHMLPSPAPPVVEQAMRRGSISRVVARESSVALELSSRKVTAVMEEFPALAKATAATSGCGSRR